jgi:HK97 family phage major capsid protein
MNRLKLVQANVEARQKIREQMMELDEKVGPDRAYDDDEQRQMDEWRSSLDAIDKRVMQGIEQEIRNAEITDATAALLGHMQPDEVRGDADRLAEDFINNEEFRSWVHHGAHGRSGLFDQPINFRAITTTTTGATSGGAFGTPTRLSRTGADFLDRRTFLIDELPNIRVNSTSVEYVQDVSPLADLVSVPAEVEENTPKPQAGITTQVVNEPIALIAAWVNITRQAADDYPQVQDYIQNRLRYAVKRRADAQVIGGNGTSPNIRGLANRSSIVTHAPGAAEARYLSIRRAIRLGEDNEAVYEIIVLNPADAELFDLSNHASAGLHASPDERGGLATAGARTAWGLRQVRSTAVAAGTALLIDPTAVAILDRQQVSTYMTDSHASNFISNVLTLLMEARLGLALFEPKGVAKVTFNGTT